MSLCKYELNVLSRIHYDGPPPENKGAAWWAAVEALSIGGYISCGEITSKGRAALARQTEGEG